MFRLVSFIVCASIGFQLAQGKIVRRVTTYDADISETVQEDQVESKPHCVVWGDWSFEGKSFRSKEEANVYFKKMKRTELAVAQYQGGRQVNKFMSKRIVRVDWLKMKEKCSTNHVDASLLEIKSPALTLESAPDNEENSHFEAASSVKTSRSTYHPVIASLAAVASTGDVRALNAKASTLSGKVSMLEYEVTSLVGKASGLFKSIGVSSEASALQVGTKMDGQGKLKSRLASLEENTARLKEKTNLLETEFFGTTAEKSGSQRQASHSFKIQIDALAGEVDELKSRLSALESTPLLGEIAKLEDKAGRLGAKAAQLFSSIGVESVTAPAALNVGSQPLKMRLGSLGEYLKDVQGNAAKLEYEILGNSWSSSQSTTSSSVKAGSIKDHAASLDDQLQDLDSRLSALASAPILADVEKMENAVKSLASRAAALYSNIGMNGGASQDGLKLASQGSALKMHILALEKSIGNVLDSTSALEEQLSGSVGTAPAQSQKDTLKSKTKFLELQVENINSRLSVLEQQV